MAYSTRTAGRFTPTAAALCDKHDEAQKYLSQAQAYLTDIEARVPPSVLEQWRADQEDWLLKVVDIRNHKTLDNPFIAPKSDGTREAVGRLGSRLSRAER